MTTEEQQKMAQDIREQIFEGDPEKKVLTDEEVIRAYIDDNHTKMNAIYWANQFNDRFRGNWFTVEQVMKKTDFKAKKGALAILQVMCLVGVCHSSENGNGVIKYKVTLDLENKIFLNEGELERIKAQKEKALKEMTFQYDMRIASIEKQIEKLKSAIAEPVVEEEFEVI